MLKKLKVSETKFRSIFENSHDVIYLSKEDGTIIDINKSAERLFGYTRDELLHLNAKELYENKEDRDRFIAEIKKNGSCENFEVVLLDKNGNKKFCVLAANVQQLEGEVVYQGIVHDLTMRKKAELDMLIAEKMTISSKIARTLAHEVRNPLTNINLSTEQLQELITDEELKPYFEIIKRNSKRINDLVTELLENSKPADLKKKEESIDEIMRNTIELARDRAKLKNISIVPELDFKGQKILADGSKMTLAILNILMNAIEAVEANTGVIKIKGSCEEDKCRITIADNGCGIPKEDLSRVFEPYYTSKPNGMGLGLATTKNIIHTHKGTIQVETELNKGTTFKIELGATH
jgi:PAS domain S-box-containing protein